MNKAIVTREKVNSFMELTGADMHTTLGYLDAEEWVLRDAVISWHIDKYNTSYQGALK